MRTSDRIRSHSDQVTAVECGGSERELGEITRTSENDTVCVNSAVSNLLVFRITWRAC